MLGHRDPPHILTSLSTTTTPKRLLFLDCAAQTKRDRGAFTKTWLYGCLGTTHYTSRKGERRDADDCHGDAQSLWSAVDTFATPNRRAVMFAYDLALQLRISQGLTWLPRMGWSLDRIVLERSAAWASFKNGKQSLMLCDLKSWCPVDFGKLAADVGYDTVESRTVTAGPDYQRDACEWRVQVIRKAVLQILNWIEGENLGPFRPTGSGQSYVAYRRRFHRDGLLVHDDPELLRTERHAMWTGRCEAWRHGHLSDGPYVEYDMHAAYCTIARDCDVPTKRLKHHYNVSIKNLERMMQTKRVLAKLEVQTDVPCLPAHVGSRTAWPVGSFRTWVWDPEIQVALQHCNEVKVLEAYTYTRAPALHDFAAWVLDGLGDQTQVYGLVPQRVLKHWSRCLVGRLGLRYRAWEHFATSDESDLRLVTYVDTDEGTMTDLLIAGHEWLILTEMQEALESLPQVPSWVMSECRARLWDAMSDLGHDNVVYVDTDSLIYRQGMDDDYLHSIFEMRGVNWSVKDTYNRMTIYGPRNYVAQDTRRVAGLPLTARQVAPLEFTGQVMRSIKESMRAGQLDCVTELPRRFVLDAPDMRRQHLPGGRTEPFRVQIKPPLNTE